MKRFKNTFLWVHTYTYIWLYTHERKNREKNSMIGQKKSNEKSRWKTQKSPRQWLRIFHCTLKAIYFRPYSEIYFRSFSNQMDLGRGNIWMNTLINSVYTSWDLPLHRKSNCICGWCSTLEGKLCTHSYIKFNFMGNG